MTMSDVMTMSDDEFDVVGGEASASPDLLAQLHASLEEAIMLEQAKVQLEEDLKAVSKSLNAVKTNRIPELMATLQMDKLSFRGWAVAISDFVSGSLPAEPELRNRAIAWLEQHDGAGLIKTKLALEFGRSQHDEAMAVAAKLQAEGWAPKVDSGVHSSTLQAFARERLRNGEPIDTDILGLYTGKVAKMTAPKEGK